MIHRMDDLRPLNPKLFIGFGLVAVELLKDVLLQELDPVDGVAIGLCQFRVTHVRCDVLESQFYFHGVTYCDIGLRWLQWQDETNSDSKVCHR